MKKWTILGVVVLAAAILFIQYMMERKAVPPQPAGGSAPAVEQPVGVALPEGASSYMARQEENTVSQAGGGASYGSITLPTIQTAYKGACEGASLREMLLTHDKYWGYFARDTAFSSDETQKMYNQLSDYVACQAVARNDISLCDYLPGVSDRDGGKAPNKLAPYFQCRDKVLPVLFAGFRAGLIKEDFSCRATVTSWEKAYVDKVSVPELCSKLSSGRAQASAYLQGIFKMPGVEDWINAAFPQKEKECGKEPQCLERYALYSGVNYNRPKDCPKEYAPHCQALAGRAAAPCEKMLEGMSQYYCASIKRVKKATAGYIGMTKEAIAADIARVKAEKAEAENQKKEQEKTLTEVNKRVRETLKKK